MKLNKYDWVPIWIVCLGILLCAVAGYAKETTTLEEALERPVKVEKFVDKENGVICYWTKGSHQRLSCVQIQPLHKKAK